MDKKAFMQTAAELAKTLRNSQQLRVTPTENYYIMRDRDGKLYIGWLTAEAQTAPYPHFFGKRPPIAQYVNGSIIAWWQKFMPSKAECIAHGAHPSNAAAMLAAK